jgi:diketogulonate reductase-like aldo/keto reductase
VIPKSTHQGRIQENADIFCNIDDEDMAELDSLNRDLRLVKGFWEPPAG